MEKEINRRNKIQMVADVLNLIVSSNHNIGDNPLNAPSYYLIVKNCNINFNRVKKIVKLLLDANLVTHSGSSSKFRATQEGKELIKAYNDFYRKWNKTLTAINRVGNKRYTVLGL